MGRAAEEQNALHSNLITHIFPLCHLDVNQKFNQTLDLMPLPTDMHLKSEGVHSNETNLLLL